MRTFARTFFSNCLFFALIFGAGPSFAATERAAHGYVQDVRKEREERFYEIFLFAEPPVREKSLSDKIFNEEISRDFRQRYREKFGTIDTESIAYQRTDYERLNAFRNDQRAETKNNERKNFADYMMKRLAETHVDNYIKSEPAMRPLYDVKEKLKKMEVRVTKKTKLEARYSLAGNVLDLILENPYCDAKWVIEMDPGTVGPAPIKENTLVLSQPLTSTWRAENRWQDREGRTSGELIKSHTRLFSTTYGLSAAYKAGGETARDSRIAFGLGYSF
jgi:hypothetical protein